VRSFRRVGSCGKFDVRDLGIPCLFQKFGVASQLIDGARRLEAGRAVGIGPVLGGKLQDLGGFL